jgi:hypothetical protein
MLVIFSPLRKMKSERVQDPLLQQQSEKLKQRSNPRCPGS